MKLTDRMKEYYLQERFFDQHGTYYYDPHRQPTDSLADDLEYEQEVLQGCGGIILTWVLIVLAILLIIKFL